MKNLFFGLIAAVLMSNVTFGQEKLTVDFSSRISKEHKLDVNDKHKLLTIKEFDREKGGTIIVVGYQEKDVVKIASVKVQYNSVESYNRGASSLAIAPDGCPGGYRACARGCNSSPTEFGVILCLGYCLIDCSGN